MGQRRIELLAPAKNTESGIAAVNYGADAVYIGAEKFGARSAAGNSAGDIEKLALYAHRYNARVYAAFNTILYDNELDEAGKLIKRLYEAGIDGLIIQDMGILEMDLPPLPLHASTQAENSSIDRIKFLDAAGFKRVVLARELSIEQVLAIRESVKCELEFFIHGALCVSYSGNCYMSAASGGRSANRGECAQPCRKQWDLVTDGGTVVASGHLLSTKDLNHTGNISLLMDSGIDSFKIEGRLKDIHYVKNITAHYRQAIDRALEKRPGIRKASSGAAAPDFTPHPERTFNRGYTEYFLHGRKGPVSSFSSPAFAGKKSAEVTGTGRNCFTVKEYEELHNGDGLSFTGSRGKLRGIRVNRVEGNRVFPLDMNEIYAGAVLYRNHDAKFEKALDTSRTERKIAVDIELAITGGFAVLSLRDEDGTTAAEKSALNGGSSGSSTSPEKGIIRHLKKLGSTMFIPRNIKISGAHRLYIQPAVLNDLRRRAAAALEQKRLEEYRPVRVKTTGGSHPFPAEELDYSYNVSNHLARRFYERHGVKKIEPAFECSGDREKTILMKTKLCLKYETGNCPVYNKTRRLDMPLFITDGKNRYPLGFNCGECVMYIYSI